MLKEPLFINILVIFLPMLNWNHYFSLFNCEKFLETDEFEPVFGLLFDIKSLKDVTVLIFESEANMAAEFVFPIF